MGVPVCSNGPHDGEALQSFRSSLQFRAELFNAFNQVNYNPPDGNVSNGTFARITSALPGRVEVPPVVPAGVIALPEAYFFPAGAGSG